jgi:hypothetical protein
MIRANDAFLQLATDKTKIVSSRGGPATNFIRMVYNSFKRS